MLEVPAVPAGSARLIQAAGRWLLARRYPAIVVWEQVVRAPWSVAIRTPISDTVGFNGRHRSEVDVHAFLMGQQMAAICGQQRFEFM